MFVMTRLSVRSRTAMHSSAILSIMACTRSASIASLIVVYCTCNYIRCQAVKPHAPAETIRALLEADAETRRSSHATVQSIRNIQSDLCGQAHLFPQTPVERRL